MPDRGNVNLGYVAVADPPGRRPEVTPDDDKSFAARAGAKYGQDFTAHDRPGERRVVVTIRPRRVYAADLRG